MKKIIFLLLLLPLSSFAQTGNLPAGLQNMMMQAQKAQSCMQGVDTSKLDGLEAEGNRMQAKVKSLCDSGQRDQAQKQAVIYSREMMARPEIKQIRKCGEMLRGMMPEMPFDNLEEKLKNQHVCDDI